ncbi:MAG: FG-GAP repeat protein [Planctomycetia bacterium]|nr:FG-GAP repeat protein [Planctomycetia bacterium]
MPALSSHAPAAARPTPPSSRPRPARRSGGRGLAACLVAAVVLAGAGCGGGGGGGGPAPVAPFEVVATSPAFDATDVGTEDVVATFTFSDPVAPTSVGDPTLDVEVAGHPVPFRWTVAPDGRTLEVVVGGAPLPGALVEVRLGIVLRASDGRPLAPSPANPLRFRLRPAEANEPSPPTADGRIDPATAVLADGRLFVTGGRRDDGGVRGDAWLGTPDAAAWTASADALDVPRHGARAARLADGRVLVVGGFTDAAGTVATATSERYDPAADAFLPGPTLAVARGAPAVVRTTDGLVVVVGGSAVRGGPAVTATLEAYDPALATFAALSVGLPVATTDAVVAPLPGGTFLVAGGVDGTGAVLPTAYVFTPGDTTARQALATGPVVPRRGAATVAAATGDVVVFGGLDAAGLPLASVEVFDPVTQTFTLLPATLSEARHGATAVSLANGAIAVVGGVLDGAGTASSAVDVFDPSTLAFVATRRLATPVVDAAVFALPAGGLWIEGGATSAASPQPARLARTSLSASALGSSLAAPRVAGFAPTAGASGVDVDATVEVRFTKAVDAASLVGAITVTDAEGEAVEGDLALAPDRVTAVFTPTRPLPVLQRLRIDVAPTVADRLGVALADDSVRSATFTTGYDLVVGSADDGSQFGYAVAMGDVNGDGRDDLVVSAYVAEPVPGSGHKPGQVYVVLGRATFGAGSAQADRFRDLSAAATAADLTITFETNGDQPGIESALQVGDLDGDGYADICVGAHNADGPGETMANAGELFVVFGQAAFPAPALQLGAAAVPGFDVLRIFGAAAGDRFGEGLAMGDVDADGHLDLLVGATGAGVPGSASLGAVYVVFGGTKAALGLSAGYGADVVGAGAAVLHNVQVLGTDASDRLGWSAAAPDLDGDGHAEIVGGATGGKGPLNTATSTGEAVVVFGAPRATLIPAGRFASYRAGPSLPIPGFVVHGDDAGDFLGWSLGAGDLDGDGYHDLAVGALLADGLGNVGNGRGEAAVVFGAARATFVPVGSTWAAYDLGAGVGAARLLRLHGEADGHSFGDCFAIDDVDGDGAADLVIGDYQARGPLDGIGANVGELSILRGAGLVPAAGTVEFALSSGDVGHPAGVRLTRLYGRTKVVRFGTSVAVGDLDGDGRADLATGANQATGLGRLFGNGGEAYVFFGRATWWK